MYCGNNVAGPLIRGFKVQIPPKTPDEVPLSKAPGIPPMAPGGARWPWQLLEQRRSSQRPQQSAAA